uniref:Uncharacterized protein n=1 Tax=Rhizophora mucronata TaxID=61149 RepID=A0A2P2P6P5_RHIMU
MACIKETKYSSAQCTCCFKHMSTALYLVGITS